MKALLIQPPFEDFYATPIRLYPLGLLYTAAVLEKAGWEVRILDALAPLRKRPLPLPAKFSYLAPVLEDPLFFRGYYRFGAGDEAILTRARSYGPDLIGISSSFTGYYSGVAPLVHLLKRELGVPIVLGGHHATAFPEEVRRRTPEVDAVLPGPAEESLPAFLCGMGRALSGGIPEIPARWGDGVRTSGRRNGGNIGVAASMDWRSLEPAHRLVEAGDYRIGRSVYASLTASRGCPRSCEFCSVHRMFGRGTNYRTQDGILDEMRRLREERGVRIFNFEDDNLSFDREWFLAFLGAAAEAPALRGVEITAMNGLDASTLDEEVLGCMVRAGFRRLNLSCVTGSAALRRAFRRPSPGAGVEALAAAASKLGLMVTVYVIIGLPGQSYQEVKTTIDGLIEMGVLVGPSVYYLAPGSAAESLVEIPSSIREDWDFYRASAFAVETEELSRKDLIDLFLYARKRNLERKAGAFQPWRREA